VADTQQVSDLYGELTNKIRWAISTSWKAYGKEISYSVAMELASGLASEVVAALMETGGRAITPTSLPSSNGHERGRTGKLGG